MEGNFSLYSTTEVTNQELVITYKPSTSVVSYKYKIYNGEEVVSEVFISSNKASNIRLTESGNYHIEVILTNKNKTLTTEKSGNYLIDVDSPIIVVKDNIIKKEQLKKNQTFTMKDLEDSIKVIDKQDGNIFDKTTCDFATIDFTKVGLYDLKCEVVDSAGNITDSTIKFNVTKSTATSLFLTRLAVVIILVVSIIILAVYQRTMKLKNRISKFTIEPINNKKEALDEQIIKISKKINGRISKLLRKSVVLTKFSKRYDKYAPLYHEYHSDSVEYLSFKIILSFTFVLASIFAKILQLKLFSLDEMIIPLLFGFFIPDFIYIIGYRVYRNRLENDFLQAITVMNNAFKSGRSITQAIELVTHELSGTISEEFKKMNLELSFGLSIEEVFKRFSKRVELEEVTYLTASLSILNKTGGNIIKVFSSIEKTMFEKKKLKLQLASLTGASKIIVWALFLVPFLFILLISIISPNYFKPFYTTTIGEVIALIMMIIYIVYIWAIRKIMKVRM